MPNSGMNMNNSDGNNLIFLISQPRSGSTMFQLMLAGHPDIATTSEPWIALHPLFALKQGLNANYDADLARMALNEFLKQSGINEEFHKKQVNCFLSSFYNQAIEHQQKKYFLDKTPRYYLIIDELIELFPKAKFIVLQRHPLAVLNSIIKTWVKNDLNRLGRYKDDLLLAPKVLLAASKKYSDKICILKYERLVENPSKILGEVCNYIGIEYHEAMSDYSERLPEWKLGDPTGIYKGSRPFTNSLQSWKNDFSSPQLELFAYSYIKELGQGVIEEMGYDFDEITETFLSSVKANTSNLTTWSYVMKHNHPNPEMNVLIAQREAMLNSLSWKFTAPFRFISNFIFKLKRSSVK